MTQVVPPDELPITSYLAKVKVTASDAISMLNTLAEANADKSQTLVASLHEAIAEIQSGTVTS